MVMLVSHTGVGTPPGLLATASGNPPSDAAGGTFGLIGHCVSISW